MGRERAARPGAPRQPAATCLLPKYSSLQQADLPCPSLLPACLPACLPALPCRWGYLSRAGVNDKSQLMRQIEKYADIYTSRVSNFLRYTPFEVRGGW